VRVRTGLVVPFRPDLSRGSLPPLSPRHHDDYRAEMEHGRIGAARRERPMRTGVWAVFLVAVAVVVVGAALLVKL
jgi:hypothetical protein